MRRMFAMFEPMAFARTIVGSFKNTAIRDEVSSGSDVPNPTMTTPITKEDMPSLSPIRSALLRKVSAPLIITAIAVTRIIAQINNVIVAICYIRVPLCANNDMNL